MDMARLGRLFVILLVPTGLKLKEIKKRTPLKVRFVL